MKPTSKHAIRQALRDEGLSVSQTATITLIGAVANDCDVCGRLLGPDLLWVESTCADCGQHSNYQLCPDRLACRERVRLAEKLRASAVVKREEAGLLAAVNIPEFAAEEPNEEPHA